jgi:hypothetical protein
MLTRLIPHILGRFLNQGSLPLNLGKRVMGGILLISGLGVGAYMLYKFLIPLFGDLISGLIMSGIFLMAGGILWCSKPSAPPLLPQEILSKAESVVENLHLPANFEKHVGKFLGTALGAGIILAYFLSHRKE